MAVALRCLRALACCAGGPTSQTVTCPPDLTRSRDPYPSASQIALSVPWRVSAAIQTFSVNRKYFIISCICAQKQYVDFKSVILDLLAKQVLRSLDSARLGQRARLAGEALGYIIWAAHSIRNS